MFKEMFSSKTRDLIIMGSILALLGYIVYLMIPDIAGNLISHWIT